MSTKAVRFRCKSHLNTILVRSNLSHVAALRRVELAIVDSHRLALVWIQRFLKRIHPPDVNNSAKISDRMATRQAQANTDWSGFTDLFEAIT